MPRTPGQLVTILGADYFQPIADLVDRLTKRSARRPDRVQAGSRESGYSASCVLLLVAMFESYVSRLRYMQGGRIPNNKRNAVDVIQIAFPKLRNQRALQDVYVLRDILIHAHLWEIDYEWGGPVPMVLKAARQHPASGDEKFKKRVNFKTYRTKALGLSVFPTRVNRSDLLKVFETIWKILGVMENANRSQCYVSQQNVQYRGRLVLFSSLQSELSSAL